MSGSATGLGPELPCGGLPARCPTCIHTYRLLVGDDVPTCVACEYRHWAYDPCGADSPNEGGDDTE